MTRARWIAAWALVFAAPTFCSAAVPKPRLVVLIVADQMRADYWLRFKPLLAKGGVRRFMDGGTYFPNAAYDDAATKTSPGHVLIGSGLYPKDSGIIGNEWFDRNANRETVSVEFSTDTAPARLKWFMGRSFADRIKAAYPQGRIVSVSIKDRAALLLTGPGQDETFWFDSGRQAFISVTPLPAWLEFFNQGIPAFEQAHDQWTPLPELSDDVLRHYAVQLSGPPPALTPAVRFNHPVLGAKIVESGYGDALLEKMVDALWNAEKLGTNKAGQPDVLAVSFSSLDLVGHVYGPDAPETLDAFLRFDRALEALMDLLELRVGKDNLLCALSSDHGVTPVPEVSRAKGYPAARVRLSFAGLPHPEWILAVSAPNIYLNEAAVHASGLSIVQAVQQVRAVAQKIPGVQAVYTDDEILRGRAPAEIARSFYLGRSGNLYVVLKPYCIFSDAQSGTTHGQPSSDDQRVPVAFYGGGVAAQRSADAVSPAIIAPTLLERLGIPTDGLSAPAALAPAP